MWMMKRLRRRLDDESGFTIVEALVSISILGIAAFAIAQTLSFGLKSSGLSRQKLAARSALDQQMEQARALNYDNLVLSDSTDLTNSTDSTNPDHWVNASTQKYDPDGAGPLAAEPIVRVAGASPALQHYQNPLVDGGTTYSVYRYVTWVDSPTDGCVAVTTQCPSAAPDSADGNNDPTTDDSAGKDEKRVVVVVTWNDLFGRGMTSLRQTSLFADGKIVYQQPAKNSPPTISCPSSTTLPQTFLTNGGNLTFAAQATDTDGTIATISWLIKYPDGTTLWNSGALPWATGKAPTVTFPLTSKTYSIVNTVVDNGGSQATNSTQSCTVQTPDLLGQTGATVDGTVIINGGATLTASPVVTLDLSKIKSGTPVGVQISNDAYSWSSKLPFSASVSWTLTSGDGVKWVYARFYDSAGLYGPASWTSITVDTGPPGPPSNLAVGSTSTQGSNKTVNLTWTAPVGVTDLGGYRVYRRLITSTAAFTLSCATATTTCADVHNKNDSYEYYVIAYDLAGNVSAQSNHITA